MMGVGIVRGCPLTDKVVISISTCQQCSLIL
jgi:hypothetical protein